MAWVRRDDKCMGFQVHIQLLCFISNYFCKSLVIVSSKLTNYKEAIVAVGRSLVSQLKGHGDEVLFIDCTIDRVVNLKNDRQHYCST